MEFEEVKIAITDSSGRLRDLTKEELDFIMHTRKNIHFIYIRKTFRLDLHLKLLQLQLKHMRGEAIELEVFKLLSKYLDISSNECIISIKNNILKITGSVAAKTAYLAYEIFNQNQYNFNNKNVKDKIVIDVGANIGMVSLLCAMLGAKKIYAFEPVKATYNLLVQNIKNNGFEDVIVPINKGVGEKPTKLTISYDMPGDTDAGFKIKDEKQYHEKIEVTSLDEFLGKEKIDLIKIDTEGYEREVLSGAKNIINAATKKPILIFECHNQEDKKQLPLLVKDIRSDYSIKQNPFFEEVFYCD